MASKQDLPITGVCVLSDPSKCPPNYTVIDQTFDRPEDADLWKDGYFSRRVMRYLCLEKSQPTQTQDVLVDVTLINERDVVPPGFTVLEYTHDSREKATKKKVVCVRWMVPTMTTDAITDLILLSRAQRRAPIGYTLVGELNSMSLCYKMGKISPQSTPSEEVPGYTAGAQTYGMPPYALKPASNSPTRPPPPAPRQRGEASPPGAPAQTTGKPQANIHPLTGIEWKMNPRYQMLMELQTLTIPEIHGKTLMDIEQKYAYDFSVEMSQVAGGSTS